MSEAGEWRVDGIMYWSGTREPWHCVLDGQDRQVAVCETQEQAAQIAREHNQHRTCQALLWRAVEVLGDIENIYDHECGYLFCPCCDRGGGRHERDCGLAALLREAKGAMG